MPYRRTAVGWKQRSRFSQWVTEAQRSSLILGKNKPKEPEGVKSGTAAEGNREQNRDTWADSGTQDRDRKDSWRT